MRDHRFFVAADSPSRHMRFSRTGRKRMAQGQWAVYAQDSVHFAARKECEPHYRHQITAKWTSHLRNYQKKVCEPLLAGVTFLNSGPQAAQQLSRRTAAMAIAAAVATWLEILMPLQTFTWLAVVHSGQSGYLKRPHPY